MIWFYTTQHIRQVEMRVRNATDILIYCEKTPAGHWLQFIDWQYREMGRRYLIPHNVAKKFYGLYDTYEVLQPLKNDGSGDSTQDKHEKIHQLREKGKQWNPKAYTKYKPREARQRIWKKEEEPSLLNTPIEDL